ncbi:SCO7613 C-terminal domain-containing membrane protein [Plantactinospora sonchi]|uniref:Permease n=1 Tax=Plantactinospora sonchi TaxID=1544735 RepID=A0ABU7RL18_9ACTN
MTEGVHAYPCPLCGAGANLATGCPGCGRGPDPAAAEVIRLDAEIAALTVRVAQARETYHTLDTTLRQTRQRRDTLAGQVRSAVLVALRAASQPGPPAQPVPTPTGTASTGGPAAFSGGGRAADVVPAPVRREASTRTVQNVLFILGGLLVGAAAIVFTVVAWATVGIAGRAAILAGLTGLALAAPILARRRGLTATAETFAAIGLLLVLLDGYAVWAVNLFGVAGLPGARYAALVTGVSAVVAAGYRRLTGLTAPWFAGLLLVQPVAPLLAFDARVGATGWTLACAAPAAVNLLLTRGRDGDGPAGLDLARRSVAWFGYGFAVLASACCALLALALTDGPGAVFAGVPLLVPPLLLIAGAVLTRHHGFGAAAGGLFVVALGGALVRAVVELDGPGLVGPAVVFALLAGGVLAAARLLPSGVRPGPYAGSLVLVAALAVLAGGMALVTALATAVQSQPFGQADLSTETGPFDWQLPVALPILAGTLVLLLPARGRWPAALAGGVLTVLALPTAVPLPWWAIALLSLGTAAALAVGAVRPDRPGWVVGTLSGAAVPLAGHALLVGGARPAGAAGVLAGIVLTGAVVAVTAARGHSDQAGPARLVGGLAVGVAVLGTPGAVVLGLFAADVPPWWQARAALAVTVLLTAGVLLAAVRTTRAPVVAASPGTEDRNSAARGAVGDYLRYAGAALSLVALVVGFSPALSGVAEPAGMYAAGTLLASVAVGAGVRPSWWPVNRLGAGTDGERLPVVVLSMASLVSMPLLLLRVVVAVLPAVVAIFLTPYAWLGRIWSGPPAGVGLGPDDWRPDVPAAVALSLLAATAAVAGWAWRGTARAATVAAVPFLAATVLTGLAAAGARWPTVPALALAGGLAALLGSALSATVGRAGRVVVPLGVALTGAGLAGLLPTRAGTLVGLALLVAAGLVAGMVGRDRYVRVSGWLATTSAAVLLAVAAPLAVDQPLRVAALLVLGVAAASLAGGVVLRGTSPATTVVPPGATPAAGVTPVDASRRAEGVAAEAAGHVAALVALVLTAGELRYAAAVCTLWGVALGIRALRPAEPGHRRWSYAATAGGAELVGIWLLLASAQVALVEAYTLPAAVLAVLVGWLAARAWPGLNSWIGYGPGLAAALLPSLVSVLVADGQPERRLLLGAGALVTVLIGARWRLQAPVVLGGVVLAVQALREMVAVWDRLPRWIFLAVGGFALISLAITYERRRRDLRRLRSAVGRMS